MARGGLPGDQLGVRHPRKKEQNVKKNCRTRSVESHERSMTKVGPRVSDPKKKESRPDNKYNDCKKPPLRKGPPKYRNLVVEWILTV